MNIKPRKFEWESAEGKSDAVSKQRQPTALHLKSNSFGKKYSTQIRLSDKAVHSRYGFLDQEDDYNRRQYASLSRTWDSGIGSRSDCEILLLCVVDETQKFPCFYHNRNLANHINHCILKYLKMQINLTNK